MWNVVLETWGPLWTPPPPWGSDMITFDAKKVTRAKQPSSVT